MRGVARRVGRLQRVAAGGDRFAAASGRMLPGAPVGTRPTTAPSVRRRAVWRSLSSFAGLIELRRAALVDVDRDPAGARGGCVPLRRRDRGGCGSGGSSRRRRGLRPPSASCSRSTGSVLVGPGSIRRRGWRLRGRRSPRPVANLGIGDPGTVYLARWSSSRARSYGSRNAGHALVTSYHPGSAATAAGWIDMMPSLERRPNEEASQCAVYGAAGRRGDSAQQAGSSPAGTAEIEIGGKWETQKAPNGRERQVYTGGKWITISYGRPIKRGRELFGSRRRLRDEV